MVTLKQVQEHYANTGEFLPEGYMYMFNFLIDDIQDIYEEYVRTYTRDSKPFGIYTLIKMSRWQVDNGFVKEYELKELDSLMNTEGVALDVEMDDSDDKNNNGFN